MIRSVVWIACVSCLMTACSGQVTTSHVDAALGGADGGAIADARLADARPDDAPVVGVDAAGAADAPVVTSDAPVVEADAPLPAADATLPAADATLPPVDAPVPMADAPVPMADAPVPMIDAPAPPDARPPDARPPDAAVADAAPPDAMGPDGPPSTGGSTIGGCAVFPDADPWHQVVTSAKADATWTAKLLAHQTKTALHPDFGNGFGIPINVVPMSEPGVAISFDINDESDPGPYPFPTTVRIEGGIPTSCGGDCHVLVVQQGVCTVWEAWACEYSSAASSWNCGSGAKFDLTMVGPGQRTKGWTSADAAGLSITAGLVRVDEVVAGHIDHAIRFTYHCTQDGFVYPASHQAVPAYPYGCPQNIDSATLRAEYPPMGTRIRLKADYPTAGLPEQARIVAEAMKTYGMILADNGSDWFFQSEDNPAWDNDQLDALKGIPSDQFEVLEMPTIER